MDLILELIGGVLTSDDFRKTVVETFDIAGMAEKECFRILEKIRNIIRDENLKDSDCFDRIEEIVLLLEESGIDCRGRHDF